MIEHASNTYSTQPNLRFINMEAQKNIFREQFDIVTSFNCLHWVAEQEKAINGIKNATVDGGTIALLLSHKKSLYHMITEQVCSSSKWSQYFIDYQSPRSFFTLDFYQEILHNSGLEIINLEEKEMVHHYESKEQIKRFFHAAGYQLKQIPEIYKEDFLNDFSEAYASEVKYNLEGIPVGFNCLQVVAKKTMFI